MKILSTKNLFLNIKFAPQFFYKFFYKSSYCFYCLNPLFWNCYDHLFGRQEPYHIVLKKSPYIDRTNFYTRPGYKPLLCIPVIYIFIKGNRRRTNINFSMSCRAAYWYFSRDEYCCITSSNVCCNLWFLSGR